MNRWSLLFILFVGMTLMFGCDTTDSDPEPISITGQVINKSSGQPLSNAIVRIVSPKPEIVKTTDDSGRYAFEKHVDSTFSIFIEARKESFDIVTQEVLAVPERDIDVPNFELIPADDDTSGGGGGGVPGDDGTGGAASIELQSLSDESISVREAGGKENASFQFQVKDSAGRPIDQEHAATVEFSISNGPGGGESISPQTTTTGENGLVSANLNSGTEAGAVKIQAIIDRGSFTIRSSPVIIAIHGGLPDEEHFGIAAETINFPGYNKFGLTNQITAYVGDKYGNIVEPGTVVYFTTDGGQIEGSAKTDEQGRATAELISNNPKPEHESLGEGYATIRARTVDENNENITTSTTVLFSGVPRIHSISPTSFSIPNGGSQEFTYSVTDQNGNPLAPGTNINVNAEGEGIEVLGDVSITLGDAFESGYGTTDFKFTIADAESDTVATRVVQITITTDGPNGQAQATISGDHDKQNSEKGRLNE